MGWIYKNILMTIIANTKWHCMLDKMIPDLSSYVIKCWNRKFFHPSAWHVTAVKHAIPIWRAGLFVHLAIRIPSPDGAWRLFAQVELLSRVEWQHASWRHSWMTSASRIWKVRMSVGFPRLRMPRMHSISMLYRYVQYYIVLWFAWVA